MTKWLSDGNRNELSHKCTHLHELAWSTMVAAPDLKKGAASEEYDTRPRKSYLRARIGNELTPQKSLMRNCGFLGLWKLSVQDLRKEEQLPTNCSSGLNILIVVIIRQQEENSASTEGHTTSMACGWVYRFIDAAT